MPEISSASEHLQIIASDIVQEKCFPNFSIPENMVFVQTKFTLRACSKSVLDFKNQIFIEQYGFPIAKVLNDGSWKFSSSAEKLFS